MAYVGLIYGNTLRGGGVTGYGATEWARAIGQSVFDYTIIGEAGFDWANANAVIDELALMANALKYMDIWGRSAYANSYDWGAFGLGWDRGPSAAGDPSLYAYGTGTGTTVYGYRMTDRHMARFFGWVENAILSAALPCKGVFLDDYLGGRQHWTGADRPKLWGAMNGRAGYDSDAYDWNLPRLNLMNQRLELLLTELALRGIDKRVLCNSGHSASYSSPERGERLRIMVEGYQRWFTREYLRGLMNEGDIKAGDVLVLQGRHWNATTETESWATIAEGNPEDTSGGHAADDSYEDIWSDALDDASEFGLDIALGWHPETSEHATALVSGGLNLDSNYSCLTDPSTLE